ncbi:MAG: hypothetical protein Satyrvirus2_27 [Satyrvirus sp.]|uniref:Uncharacterized protein n=1 Tax=Satyrvirus sp. TaxID=2487771 RepID=A0A3G5ACT3_9VIRU|nr:MAG: hypothetical protein Satyrvirus2_27 [Satyrvirus sp.]
MANLEHEIQQKKVELIKKRNREVTSDIWFDITNDDDDLLTECNPKILNKIRDILERNNVQIIMDINKLITKASEKKSAYIKNLNQTYNLLATTLEECFEKNKETFEFTISGKYDSLWYGTIIEDTNDTELMKQLMYHWDVLNKEKADAIKIFFNELQSQGYHPERILGDIDFLSSVDYRFYTISILLRCNLKKN